MDFVNPKVSPGADPVDEWYRYYAGYSAAFVEHALIEVAPDASTILDPWNGTGTTTVVAASRKTAAYGFDINPAMVVVSRARLLGTGVGGSISALSDDVVGHATLVEIAGDPLRFWFKDESAAAIRGLQASVHRLLVDSGASAYPVHGVVSRMSTLAAFFYTSIFRTVRVLIEPAAGTNPTWWKRLPDEERLDPERNSINEHFRSSVAELTEGLHRAHFDVHVNTTVDVGDCREIPITNSSVDAVISSPPYCTRIDYGISTRPELAILGANEADIKALRNTMVGTPTVTGEEGTEKSWGQLATTFLTKVTEHESKASQGYYAKYYRQYYAGMWTSLGELRRVTRAGGPVLLVVQDNHYKELRNDTPGILTEMAQRQGFTDTARYDFSVAHNRASMNPHSRRYRPKAKAVESVLVFR